MEGEIPYRPKKLSIFLLRLEGRCIPISVLFTSRQGESLYNQAAAQSPNIAARSAAKKTVDTRMAKHILKIKLSCGSFHNNPSCRENKNRYQSASLTVEAALAFPVFFFCVLYLLQMFLVLQAELAAAEAGLTSARDAAVVSYAAERLKKGESAIPEKILSVFDYKIVRDAAATAVFYERVDRQLFKRAGVAQGIGGLWTDTQMQGKKLQFQIYFSVQPGNALFPKSRGYYCISLMARPWTGEGELKKEQAGQEQAQEKAYLAENATVYHLYADCTYINIKTQAVASKEINSQKNASGAKYYACEFCKPVLGKTDFVYITVFGTRYHALSSCSAIERRPREVSLEEAKENYRLCTKCEKKSMSSDSQE